jgi:biotin operon repressor
MSLHNRIASEPQPNFPDSIYREPRSLKHTPASVLAIVAGIVLALASAATNGIYGWARSDLLASQITWAAVSVSASAILALAPTAFLKAVEARSLTGSLVAVLAIGLCGAYSFSAAIGASAGQRITAQVTQTDTDGTKARLQKAYETASSELQGLPPSSGTTGELDAKIAVLKQTPGANDCAKIDGPVSKKVCPEAAALEVEGARSARREELQTTMANATRDLAQLGSPKVANTDASAISAYLALAGIDVSTDALNRCLALLAVALVEFGGGLSFAVSTVLKYQAADARIEHLEANVPNRPQIHVADTVEEADEISVRLGVHPVSTSTPLKLVVPENYSGRLLMMLKERGGEVYSGHRALGRALGCSSAHVGNVLKELASSGRVTVNATKNGTVVRLAA